MRRNLFPDHKRIKGDRVVVNRAYLKWFAEQKFPCHICGSTKGVEGHHIKRDSNDPKNDEQMMPLCKEHHKGYSLSPHGTPVLFRNKYPMDVQYGIGDLYFQKWIES